MGTSGRRRFPSPVAVSRPREWMDGGLNHPFHKRGMGAQPVKGELEGVNICAV